MLSQLIRDCEDTIHSPGSDLSACCKRASPDPVAKTAKIYFVDAMLRKSFSLKKLRFKKALFCQSCASKKLRFAKEDFRRLLKRCPRDTEQ